MSTLISSFAAVVLISVTGTAVAGQAAPPSTDIFLAPIRMQNDKPTVGRPVNITQRPGYDNQPSFTPDSRSVLFTSVRELLNLCRSRTSRNITCTPNRFRFPKTPLKR